MRHRNTGLNVAMGILLAVSLGDVGGGMALGAEKELTEAELKAYQQKMSGSDFLSIDFTQTRYSAMRKKGSKSQGTARFAQPEKFLWRIETPMQKQWIFDGNTLYQYEPAIKQAVKFSAGGKAADLTQIVDLVINFDTLLKRYKLESAKHTGGKVEIVLSPKSASDVVRVDLQIDEKESYLSHMKLHMVGGDHLAIDFNNPIRTKIDAKEFTLPSGVSVSEGT